MKLIEKLKQLGQFDIQIDKVQRNTYDTMASILLHRLFDNHIILPFSPFSLNPNTILHVLNDVQVNNRTSVIEFGSGVSTLILAKFIKSNKLETTIVSVDHNADWSRYIKKELQKHDCSNIVQLVVAPLTEYKTEAYTGLWYNKKDLTTAMAQKNFDVVLVDGPGGGTHAQARYLALPTVISLLQPNFIVFLDDIRRKGERQILNRWQQLFDQAKVPFIINQDAKKVYATLKSKGGFSTNPMTY